MTEGTPSRQPSVNRWEIAALALLLAVYFAALTALARRTGVTVDEPAHILSSILYWEGRDNLQPQDMPPAIKIVGGWAAADARFKIPDEKEPVWKGNHEWNIGLDMIRKMDEHQIRRAMFRARLPMFVFPAATLILLWWWGRQLFSPLTGVVLAALFALEPTALGHAPLYKNDHASAFGYLLFWYRAWCYWRAPSIVNAVWLGVGVLAALLAKLSMILVLLASPFVLLRKPRLLPATLPVLLLVVWTGVAAAYQFDFGSDTLHWFPPRLAQGVRNLIGNNAGDNAVYLLGERWPRGHRGYFLVSAAVKAPLALQLLMLAGAALAVRRRRWEDLMWLIPGPLYFAMASMSSLQLGLRLVMPSLPFALLYAGHAVQKLESTRWRWALPAVLAVLTIQNVWIYPHQLSFFNTLAGGPVRALHYLSGSNVDWGQDLWALRRFMQQNRIPRIHLSYFGADNVWAYFKGEEVQWIQPPYAKGDVESPVYQPEPGYYAISATLLTGQFFPAGYRRYYGAFRRMTPIGYAGYSIYIYRVP
jgi:hypothetical protein